MEAGHPLATLANIWRYPVKSLKAQALERADVGERGLAGDRADALFLATPDRARSGKTFRGKEHRLLHTVSQPGDAVALVASDGFALEVRGGGPFFDAQPVSLIFDRWIAELERNLGMPLDPLRYRPNLFAHALEPAFPGESELVGAVLQIGGVRLRVVSPIDRCVTTTYDVETGESAPQVLRAVAEHRDNMMGVYCAVETPGSLAAGDTILRY
jgi:hypothetical protein